MEQRKRGLALAVAAVVFGACGDDAQPVAEGASMAPAGIDTRVVEPETTPALNDAPVISAVSLSPDAPRPGETVTANVDASDPNGDPMTLEYQWRVDGERVDGNGSKLHVDARKGARIEVRVYAHDGQAKSTVETASIGVGNLPPVIQGVVMEPLDELRAGRDVSAVPRAMDPDGDEVSFRYRWDVNGSTVSSAQSSMLSHRHFERGDKVVLTVWASDGSADSEPLKSAPIPVVNAPPAVTSAPGGIGEDGVFRYVISAEDPDGDRDFRYRLAEGPEGMEVDVVDGALVWAPGEDQGGAHPVRLEVRDVKGATTVQSFVINVGFEELPAAPPES